MRRYRIKCVVISGTCLLLGFFIYLFMRSNTYIHEIMPETVNLFLREIRFGRADTFLNKIIKYYFADFLWGLSFAFALCAVSVEFCEKNIFKCSLYAFLIGILFELAQYFSIINGTFDFVDICMYAAASVSCAAVNIKFFQRSKL